MREVAVIGGGTTIFGKFPLRSMEELGKEAVLAAISDAGIKGRDIEFGCCSTIYGGFCIGQRVFKEAGISGIEILNVENGCAGGASAFREAWYRIATDQCDIAIAAGVESMTTSPVAEKLIPPPPDDLDGQLGMVVPMFFAMLMRRHMYEHGTTLKQIAQVSVKNHQNGCLNPYSQYQKEFSPIEVLESRMICDPITLLQCCPNTDGAAAVILCSKKMAKRFTHRPVVVASSVLQSGDFMFRWKDTTFSDMCHRAGNTAYEMAGIGAEDIDCIELHDAFAICEIMHYEDLGLCKRGEGGKLIEEGITWLGGDLPVNPSGGLLSKGHPLSATGLAQIVEIYKQLRGMAGQHQVEGAKVGLTQVVGGYVAGMESGAVSVHILKV